MKNILTTGISLIPIFSHAHGSMGRRKERNRFYKITFIILEEWANGLIKKYSMTRKEWQNIKTVISGIFKYAIIKSPKT